MFPRRYHSILPSAIYLTGLAVAFALAAPAQTVTAPASNETLKAADDFATLTFQDPWDMSQMTDVGWFTYSVDAPASNLTFPNPSNPMSGGIFSATTDSTVPNSGWPNFWLLDPNAPTELQLGKVGTVYPIDSTKYRRFLIRMNLSGSALGNPLASGGAQYSHLIWNLYGALSGQSPQSTSNVFPVYAGWWIYAVDLPTLGSAAGPTWTASNPVQSL